MMFGDGFVTYCYASKVIKGRLFPSKYSLTVWVCQVQPAQGSKVTAHPSQESHRYCQQSQESYCSLWGIILWWFTEGYYKVFIWLYHSYVTQTQKNFCFTDATIVVKLKVSKSCGLRLLWGLEFEKRYVQKVYPSITAYLNQGWSCSQLTLSETSPVASSLQGWRIHGLINTYGHIKL